MGRKVSDELLSPTARQNCLVGTAHSFTLRTLSSQSAHFSYPKVEGRGSRNSVIGIVTRLRSGWYGPRKPARASPNHPHWLCYPPSPPNTKYWSTFLRIKQPRRDVGHWPSSSTEVKNEWSWNSNPHASLHGLFRVSFTFTVQSRIDNTNSPEHGPNSRCQNLADHRILSRVCWWVKWTQQNFISVLAYFTFRRKHLTFITYDTDGNIRKSVIYLMLKSNIHGIRHKESIKYTVTQNVYFINILKQIYFTHALGCNTESIQNSIYRAQLCVLYDYQKKNNEYFSEKH